MKILINKNELKATSTTDLNSMLMALGWNPTTPNTKESDEFQLIREAIIDEINDRIRKIFIIED